jgi:enamine deaminase RidA (YjgF/YER057c/UK114 family)
MTNDTLGDTALSRLQALGYALPQLPPPGKAKYAEYQRLDASIYVAGQLPTLDGHLPEQGLLGRDVDLDAGRRLARIAAVNCLAVAAAAAGGLDRVRLVQMLVFVASTPEFGDQSGVADAASSLLLDVLGPNGEHARTAIGVASLPRNSPVEIQMICTSA